MKQVVAVLLLFFSFATAPAPVQAGEVHLAFASSLREAVAEIADGFARSHPGVRFLKNGGGSGALAKQVESGAPCDVFISANAEWIDYLKGKGLLEAGSVTPFTANALVFVGKPSTAATGMGDLPRLGRIAIGSPKSVPAGEYALQALRRSGVEGRVKDKLVMAKDARGALMYAERGEVDGAFVYRSDALLARQVQILFAVPPQLHAVIVYPMALTRAGARNRDALAFFDYLKGREARGVLARHGFAAK